MGPNTRSTVVDGLSTSAKPYIYFPFTKKRIVSIYFGRDVRIHFGVAISEGSGPPVFHIKVGASKSFGMIRQGE